MGESRIRELIDRVRGRWRRLMTLRAATRAALAAALVLAVALLVSRAAGRSPIVLTIVALCGVLLMAALVAWCLWPLRRRPSDERVARFIEETEPSLDDRLVSAVALTRKEGTPRPLFAEPMLADAAERASRVDPRAIVPTARLRRAGLEAAAAMLIFGGVAFVGRTVAKQSFDAVSLSLFPSRITLDVSPGNARIKAGTPLTIEASIRGNSAPVVARVLRADGDAPDASWKAAEMTADASGTFRLPLGSPDVSFRYRVAAGAATSPIYTVTVARPPRVARIDLEYSFPREFGLPPRTEEDTGDIYAPAGTSVRVVAHTDRDAASAHMTLTNGSSISLVRENPTLFSTRFTVAEDGSYRLALSDASGLSSPGDTEYFIRTLEDRPPDVHILHPARDREVTRLEEVDVQARADDDFGIAGMDLVYSVNGAAERVLPVPIPARDASVTGARTLYLEDLHVAPGDFVSYYVRARDVGRGKRSSETKSDLFFLQVRPFDQEFRLADSQGAGGGSNRQLDDLVQAQKDIVVSTWKLQRRGETAGATPADDIRAVGKGESELKTRVEEMSSSFRETTMRDPRARGAQRSLQAQPGEDDMTAAAAAMGKAAASLDALKTNDAVPPEMDALNRLLHAQSEIKQRQVQSQQAGRSSGENRSNVDLSNLFDRELQRQQRTNYETKSSTEQRGDEATLDKVRDLARRQDELNERQKELARRSNQMSPDEVKRELEKLTREQSDLRQQAEELAQNLQNQGSQGSQSSQGSRGSRGSRGSQGSQNAQNAVRAAADAMRGATNNLRQQNPSGASQQGAQAAGRLRVLADQMASGSAGSADDRRRALGDMQLEARQMADAQRQISGALQGAGRGGPQAADTMRRLAGEEERLADRAAQLQAGLGRQASAGGQDSANPAPPALAGAAREFERQRVPDRMKQAADAMRSAAQQTQPAQTPDAVAAQAAAGNQLARDLDRLAESLAGASAPQDRESQKLADERARAQSLRADIERLSAAMKTAQTAAALAQLRDEYAKELQQAQQLLEQLKRDDPSLAQAGMGFTFEGQGMTLSAPGTEAFKQDFAKWDELRSRATDALAKAETAIDERLQGKAGTAHLAAGVDDRPPAAYQSQVDSYFKALADKKR